MKKAGSRIEIMNMVPHLNFGIETREENEKRCDAPLKVVPLHGKDSTLSKLHYTLDLIADFL